MKIHYLFKRKHVKNLYINIYTLQNEFAFVLKYSFDLLNDLFHSNALPQCIDVCVKNNSY